VFNFFNSNVFMEIGAAIGNVGHALFDRRQRSAELVGEAFQRRLEQLPQVALPLLEGEARFPDDEVIDAHFIVLDDTEGGL
jgi:hypothetical protein